ncbi:hypothetical protein U1Q18_025200, partial [Sarracenia purpurea var. burkii]
MAKARYSLGLFPDFIVVTFLAPSSSFIKLLCRFAWLSCLSRVWYLFGCVGYLHASLIGMEGLVIGWVEGRGCG